MDSLRRVLRGRRAHPRHRRRTGLESRDPDHASTFPICAAPRTSPHSPRTTTGRRDPGGGRHPAVALNILGARESRSRGTRRGAPVDERRSTVHGRFATVAGSGSTVVGRRQSRAGQRHVAPRAAAIDSQRPAPFVLAPQRRAPDDADDSAHDACLTTDDSARHAFHSPRQSHSPRSRRRRESTRLPVARRPRPQHSPHAQTA